MYSYTCPHSPSVDVMWAHVYRRQKLYVTTWIRASNCTLRVAPFHRYGRKTNKKSWRKLETDHQHGQYYEHCSCSVADQSCHENWRRSSDVCPSFLSIGGTRRSALLGKIRRTNGTNMRKPTWTRNVKLAGRGKHDARLGRWCKCKARIGTQEIRSFELSRKEIFAKSKEEKNKKNGSKKNAHRGQSVR